MLTLHFHYYSAYIVKDDKTNFIHVFQKKLNDKVVFAKKKEKALFVTLCAPPLHWGSRNGELVEGRDKGRWNRYI